jgi:hypothetical protein
MMVILVIPRSIEFTVIPVPSNFWAETIDSKSSVGLCDFAELMRRERFGPIGNFSWKNITGHGGTGMGHSYCHHPRRRIFY